MMSDVFSAISANEECHIGVYILLNSIGKGCFVKVRLARHILAGTEVAVKALTRQDSSEDFREVNCLKSY